MTHNHSYRQAEIQRLYDAGRYAEGQALNRAVGIARSGTPESGGAVTNSARRDAAGGRIALGDGSATAKSLEGAANREVPEPGAVSRRAARRLPAKPNADLLGFASRQSLSSRDSSATGDLGPDGSATTKAGQSAPVPPQDSSKSVWPDRGGVILTGHADPGQKGRTA